MDQATISGSLGWHHQVGQQETDIKTWMVTESYAFKLEPCDHGLSLSLSTLKNTPCQGPFNLYYK